MLLLCLKKQTTVTTNVSKCVDEFTFVVRRIRIEGFCGSVVRENACSDLAIGYLIECGN